MRTRIENHQYIIAMEFRRRRYAMLHHQYRLMWMGDKSNDALEMQMAEQSRQAIANPSGHLTCYVDDFSDSYIAELDAFDAAMNEFSMLHVFGNAGH